MQAVVSQVCVPTLERGNEGGPQGREVEKKRARASRKMVSQVCVPTQSVGTREREAWERGILNLLRRSELLGADAHAG